MPEAAESRRLVIAVFCLALVVRILYLVEFSRSVFFASPILDAAWHDGWARRIAAGSLFDGAPYFRAPLYGWFLAVVYRFLGEGPWPIRLVQSVVTAAAAAGVTAIVLPRFGRRVGVIAGVVLAVYGPAIFLAGELLIEAALFVPLLVWATAEALRAHDSGGAEEAPLAPWFRTGIALGLAAIARPNALVLAPALLALPFLRGPAPGRIGARAEAGRIALPLLLGLALPVLPITLINFTSSGDLILIASQGGINAYAGNNAEADGRSVVVPALGREVSWEEFVPRATAVAEKAAGGRLRPSEVSDYWSGEARRWSLSNPVAAGRLLLRKIGWLLSGYEAPNNRDYYVARRESLLLELTGGRFGPLLLPLGLLFPLALLGLALASPDERRRLAPLLVLAAAYAASLLPFFICDRFRLPLVLWFAIPAALALDRLPGLIRGRRIPPLPVCIFLAGLGVANWSHGADTAGRSSDAWHKLGEALYNRGQYPAALGAFDAALMRAPGDNLPRLGRAFALQALGQDSLAGVELGDLVHRLPDSWQAQHGYGRWLLDHDRPGDAVPYLERAAGLHPERAELHRDLGFAYELTGNDVTAGMALKRALDLGEESAELHLSLGLVAYRRGAPALAERNWERGLELDPRHFRTLYNLGLLRLGQGRADEARRLWGRASEVRPADPRIPVQLARLEARLGRSDAARAAVAHALELGVARAELETDPLLSPLLP